VEEVRVGGGGLFLVAVLEFELFVEARMLQRRGKIVREDGSGRRPPRASVRDRDILVSLAATPGIALSLSLSLSVVPNLYAVCERSLVFGCYSVSPKTTVLVKDPKIKLHWYSADMILAYYCYPVRKCSASPSKYVSLKLMDFMSFVWIPHSPT